MRTLHFDYYMQIDYTETVVSCHFTIKCIPKDNARQRISNVALELFPEVDYSRNTDSFGNNLIYGRVGKPHDTFRFRISGDAETDCADYEEEADEDQIAIFRYPYGLNRPGDSLKAYFRELTPVEGENDLEKSIVIMHRLYRDFTYEKNCTTIATTAEEAWALGKGVCQDYAHIMIAILHMAKIPARYVTGMLIGEGASHAWVEVLSDGKWYGIDPTNDIVVRDSYIKLGTGRDASDCAINRGVMRGGGNQTQLVRVTVLVS